MTTIKQVPLANGLEIVFTDESNRYFGDYHRVCILATIVCNLHDLPVQSLDDRTLRRQATEAFGGQMSIAKRIERMGVPTLDIDRVRNALIDDFLRHAVSYMSRPGFPSSLVRAELNKHPACRYYD